MSECVTKLRCPVCGSYLSTEDNRLLCKTCATAYDDLDELSEHLPAYNAALNERMKLEFKNSEIFYNQILDENFELAKPHLCLLLAEFGTQLFADANGKLNYIVHNAAKSSVFDSANYKNAIRFAPVKEKACFVEKALKIEDARKSAEKAVERRSEYDIFVCQKCVQNDGNHTREYDYGYGLSEILKENGYKVYFADRDYSDPFADASLWEALSKSRSMIVISSSKQNADGIALKQLWGRYLYLIENSLRRSDSLIPVSLTFDESSFPARLRKLHCLKVAEAGCEQKLLNRLRDVLAATEADEAELRFMKDNIKAAVRQGKLKMQEPNERSLSPKNKSEILSVQEKNPPLTILSPKTSAELSDTASSHNEDAEQATGRREKEGSDMRVSEVPASSPSIDTDLRSDAKEGEFVSPSINTDRRPDKKEGSSVTQADGGSETVSSDTTDSRKQSFSESSDSHTQENRGDLSPSSSPQHSDTEREHMLIEEGVVKEYTGMQTTVRIPEYVVAIAEKAFYNNQFIEKLILHKTFTDIGDGAFSFCPKLKEIEFGGTKRIGKRAFFGCSALLNVSLGEDVEILSDAAFGECQSVKTLSVGKSLKALGGRVFAGCPMLEKIKVSPSNPYMKCVDDSLVSTDVKTLFLSPSLRKKKTYRLPTTIERIHNAAFYGSNLQNISLFSSLIAIEDSAFTACHIQNISLPQDLRTIGSRAFERCKFLESIRIPKRVKTIESYTFCGCQALEKVTMENVEHIRENAFEGCGNLVNVSFSEHLKSIGAKAFLKCKKLKKPTLPHEIEKVDKTAFEP